MTQCLKALCAMLSVFALMISSESPEYAQLETEPSVPETVVSETVQTLPSPTEPVPESTEAAASQNGQSGNSTKRPSVTSAATDPMTKGYRDIPLYFQTDYPNKRFGSGTVADNGCSITSLAMVATYLTGHVYLPDELAGYFGGYGENNVQRLEYGAQQLQLPIHKATDIRDVFSALKQGDIAIVLMNHLSIFTETQHFVVLTGLNEDGKIMVNDSFAPNYEKWDLKRAYEEGFEEADILLGYHGGWTFDVSAMPKEPFIYVEEKPYVEPRYPGVELTWEEQQLMAKLVWLEARGESADGQQAVAEIVLNRLVSGKHGDTISEVIYGEGQFRTTPFLKDAEAWQAQYEAVDRALSGPYVLPIDVIYFATYPENNRIWGKIGGHYFCYE